ncbi:aminomethyl-transferring glycine dehydrogenase subunit GcvPB [Halalkalibacterium halodurans]|uniref:Probable glycine dehydrogenase (decarboxylating) subunit 2 n=1 Tax=Halalkalibacterium halodurans (strain ATCC BAA-125 / DSM 18197 / FERM 7344 / JCM 9153 / C-125) TaxID=272558 RepID=GCSPB_HALH5|nr:aminomethyl-transferring glycine dehydrogenase subunit GcvPB [Halalkalibacterium halodurans]Q9K936.1 RecName: Full=Probable glycine dehydrogenase (decarboxylating) subunit 2; AltName: Full=Glycine cleavage system P-protein subunit 2; AltName: Full=Glycine decarboxylase subunit 2; AltName: Full=Glycine dehydrogenase (aminomethyl-transferring) subunit 2 [Halalkalibacterium halodurans C-125]MED4081705.1 aminomethyl-transferring glycine dehydrogenase subunit GcvPB [Halalkalibacterium halodurans]M
MMNKDQALIFELSKPGRVGHSLPELDVLEQPVETLIPAEFLREEAPELPEVSELQLMRHYTALSKRNHGVDSGFYPLGSCTMKYNPKINEDVARYPGFANIHPYQPEAQVQGALRLMYELQTALAEITGMDEVTLQPAAGAQGEWTGLMLIRAYHEANGDTNRTKVIVPDSAHGTNPASATVAGFESVTVRTDEDGLVDLDHLREVVGEDTAALMLTNPNTLGLFEAHIVEMAAIIHEAGGKLYYDGANSNAILGIARPGDMGFDVVHLNLHKTFTGPHGGGGPGSGPVGVKKELIPYLPKPVVVKDGDSYRLDYDRPHSIGRVKPYYGNFGINVRAYTYIRTMGPEGLRTVSEYAVLNANYMMRRLAPYFDLPYDQHCKHEFVLSGRQQKKLGVRTLDIAKRLLDFGYHPPTIYFPLNVEECLMIEPTETESKETLDEFIEAMIQIAKEAEETPEVVQEAPHHTVIGRLDETTAARKPILRYEKITQ